MVSCQKGLTRGEFTVIDEFPHKGLVNLMLLLLLTGLENVEQGVELPVIWDASTHWGWVTHIGVSKLTIINSDSGLSPGRRQAIIWINVGILLIGPLGTSFSDIVVEIHAFSFGKMHLKVSSGKLRPFCLGQNVLTFKWRHCDEHCQTY